MTPWIYICAEGVSVDVLEDTIYGNPMVRKRETRSEEDMRLEYDFIDMGSGRRPSYGRNAARRHAR